MGGKRGIGGGLYGAGFGSSAAPPQRDVHNRHGGAARGFWIWTRLQHFGERADGGGELLPCHGSRVITGEFLIHLDERLRLRVGDEVAELAERDVVHGAERVQRVLAPGVVAHERGWI
ncbi:MAG: hypothetical protein SFZ23_09330 [Planctomycetota bacterium]|nr:hypothetical protein [Planctomycetota bacterium]